MVNSKLLILFLLNFSLSVKSISIFLILKTSSNGGKVFNDAFCFPPFSKKIFYIFILLISLLFSSLFVDNENSFSIFLYSYNVVEVSSPPMLKSI